jgi:hypothetical protein
LPNSPPPPLRLRALIPFTTAPACDCRQCGHARPSRSTAGRTAARWDGRWHGRAAALRDECAGQPTARHEHVRMTARATGGTRGRVTAPPRTAEIHGQFQNCANDFKLPPPLERNQLEVVYLFFLRVKWINFLSVLNLQAHRGICPRW